MRHSTLFRTFTFFLLWVCLWFLSSCVHTKLIVGKAPDLSSRVKISEAERKPAIGTSHFFRIETKKKESLAQKPKNKVKRNPKEKNTHAIRAFVYSILGLILAIPPVNIILLTAALIHGIKALHQFHKEPGRYKGKFFAFFPFIIIGLLLILTAILLIFHLSPLTIF